MDSFSSWLSDVDSVVWGPFVLIPLLLGTGLWLTYRLRAVQFRKLFSALRLGLLDREDDGGEGDITQYQALTTALAATVEALGFTVPAGGTNPLPRSAAEGLLAEPDAADRLWAAGVVDRRHASWLASRPTSLGDWGPWLAPPRSR